MKKDFTKVEVGKKYRIKTEEEFIAEYGENFRDVVGEPDWISPMDYLFGEVITVKELIRQNSDNGVWMFQSAENIEGFFMLRETMVVPV